MSEQEATFQPTVRPRGVRTSVVFDSKLSIAVAKANAEADRIEEGTGYVLDMSHSRDGDRHYVLVKYTWGGEEARDP